MTLTMGELFAGIGGFSSGFHRAGFETRWFVEWDRDCERVLSHHFPGVPVWGDISTVGHVAGQLEPVDVITFGSPCQDLSVAGKRAGLDGARSGLFYEACRIIGTVRPAIAVWENVPGAFSSNRGRDFGAVLDALAELGALDIGWRVLDSQWFGVAQRRRRVFVVADFRGKRAGEILAFADSLSGHPAPRRTAGQDVAGPLSQGASSGGGHRQDLDGTTYVANHVADALTTRVGESRGQDPVIPITFDDQRGRANGGFGFDQARTLQAAKGQSEQQLVVAIQDGSMPRAKKQNGIGIAYDASMYMLDDHGAHAVAHTLSANGADASEDGTGRGAPLVVDLAQVTSPGNYSNPQPGDPCHPLTSAANQSVVAFNWQSGGDQRLGLSAERVTALGTSQTPAIAFSSKDSGNDAGDIAPTLRAMPHDTSHSNGGGQVAVAMSSQLGSVEDGSPPLRAQPAGLGYPMSQGTTVRRLTPTECERLQSFPDNWTAVDGMSDSARYRMLGNAVTVNVTEWLGQRIAEALR